MSIRRTLAACMAATALLAATPALAEYRGTITYETNYDESDYVILRDGRDELHMRGTDRWCNRYGQGDDNAYQRIRDIDRAGRTVSWNIVGRCSDSWGDFVKVCVRGTNVYGSFDTPCTTYRNLGWR